MPRHLLSLFDLTREETLKLIERGLWFKSEDRLRRRHNILDGKTIALVFEKPSTRTRISFDVAASQLGGHAVDVSPATSQLGRGETYEDTARVLARYVDSIVVRTFEQTRIEKIASASGVPVINGLTDLYHPCQVLADLATVVENFGSLEKMKIVYIGDGNNMANTWITAAIILGFELCISTPKGYEPAAMLLKKLKDYSNINFTHDPKEAVSGANVINTDTWVSMGQEGLLTQGAKEKEKKEKFKPYQINNGLLKLADPSAIVLHCLPAHRGEEITDDVMDGPQSRIFDQAEMRLHVQKAILEKFVCQIQS